MSDLVMPMTAHARGVLARRGSLRRHALPVAETGTGSTPGSTPGSTEPTSADDRLLRRELLLHHLEMERQRRRRRSA